MRLLTIDAEQKELMCKSAKSPATRREKRMFSNSPALRYLEIAETVEV